MKNKKRTIIILVTIVILMIGLLIFFVLRSREDDVIISEPVIQKSISPSKQKVQVSLGNTGSQGGSYEVFAISQTFKLSAIKKLALDNALKLTVSDENVYYSWQRDQNIIAYDMVANKLSVSGENLVISDRTNEDLFSDIAEKYFDEQWKYEIVSKNEKTDRTEYLAQRKLLNGSLVESRENKHETDRIVVEDGKITSVTLTLSNFSSTGKSVPLLSKTNLRKYINQQDYPKEILPSYDSLNSVMEMENYQSYEEIAKTLDNCIAEKIDVVYYYKNVEQGALTPVYKAISMCDIVHEKKRYQVPTVIYINAIDPNYILEEESQ